MRKVMMQHVKNKRDVVAQLIQSETVKVWTNP
jgi:hypothetical protein